MSRPHTPSADARVVFENELVVLHWDDARRDDNQIRVHVEGEPDPAAIVPLDDSHEHSALIDITLKGPAPLTPESPPEPQFYPNIPIELLLDNDRLIVQRVQIAPDQWEGVHSHPGNQVFIHIHGGRWRAREDGQPTGPIVHREPGDAGWMGEIGLDEGHEYGNVGDTTIDLVWITLK